MGIYIQGVNNLEMFISELSAVTYIRIYNYYMYFRQAVLQMLYSGSMVSLYSKESIKFGHESPNTLWWNVIGQQMNQTKDFNMPKILERVSKDSASHIKVEVSERNPMFEGY